MRVTVNLATRPFADIAPILRRLRIAMGVLALLALTLGVGLHLLHSKAEAARATERQVDGQIAQITQEQQGYKSIIAQPANSQVLDQAAALNKLIDTKAFSWTLAMEDLETVLPGGVQVSTLEPTVDKKDGHITVRLRVVGPRDKAVDLVKNLEHSRRFLIPRIVNEAIESTGNGAQQLEPVSASNRVNFDILADYNPATPEERKANRRKAAAEQTHVSPPVPIRSVRPIVRPNAPGPGLRRPPVPMPPGQRRPYTEPPAAVTPRSVPPNPFPGDPNSPAPANQDTRPTPPQAFTGGPR